MHYKTFLTTFICAAYALLLQAADTSVSQVQVSAADAIDAAAQANGTAYNDAKISFDALIKSDQLEDSFIAAQTLLACAAKPGKGQWRNSEQTYAYLAKAYNNKKIFARKQAIALYEEAIGKLSGNALADMLMEYGFYLDDYALADAAKTKATVDQAFQVADLAVEKKIALCRRAALRNNWAELDTYVEKALDFAADDVTAQASIWQWKLSANIREQPLEDLCKAYETFLINETFKDHIHRPNSAFAVYVQELIRRKQFDRALALLDQVPEDLNSSTFLNYRRMKADLYQQAAERFYDKPDPDDLKLAIGVYETIIADIPTNQVRNTLSYQRMIAELAFQAGDTQRAKATAEATLQLIDNPENQESHLLFYLLGRIAYEAEDYAEATRILEEAYTIIRENPGRFTKRREMVEDLMRSACAIGDYAKSAQYADDLLELVRKHEKKRYEIYIDGLKARVVATKP